MKTCSIICCAYLLLNKQISSEYRLDGWILYKFLSHWLSIFCYSIWCFCFTKILCVMFMFMYVCMCYWEYELCVFNVFVTKMCLFEELLVYGCICLVVQHFRYFFDIFLTCKPTEPLKHSNKKFENNTKNLKTKNWTQKFLNRFVTYKHYQLVTSNIQTMK